MPSPAVKIAQPSAAPTSPSAIDTSQDLGPSISLNTSLGTRARPMKPAKNPRSSAPITWGPPESWAVSTLHREPRAVTALAGTRLRHVRGHRVVDHQLEHRVRWVEDGDVGPHVQEGERSLLARLYPRPVHGEADASWNGEMFAACMWRAEPMNLLTGITNSGSVGTMASATV